MYIHWKKYREICIGNKGKNFFWRNLQCRMLENVGSVEKQPGETKCN